MPHEPSYDIVVIGAGIQGAGVAQAAAVCKYKTLILEKSPSAGLGTSSKSSKLIHGGLRYLETGQFKLVMQSLLERKRLLRNAPHLVKFIPFFIPVYANSSRPAWLIWLGLCLYSVFSLKKFHIVKKSEWRDLDGLNLKNLKTVFKYYDAQTDDTALTQAVMKSAQEHGAEVMYDAHFLTSQVINGHHQLTFKQNNQTSTVKCNCIINCSGPWAELVQAGITPSLKLPDIELVAGAHIIIRRRLNQGAYYIQANDKRAIFILPWKEHKCGEDTAMIGTTETPYSEDPDKVTPTPREISYLLENYNRHFNNNTSNEDVIESFSGLRVLPASKRGENELSFKKPRDSLIVYSNTAPALITLIGGKLTTYRSSSEKVINLLRKILPLNNLSPSRTRNIKLK
ncbi:Aerobic glycerol-3-phosphate dehydrogenase [hydrothermal vent metagenome]|uniref:Aerobic glycerol-3-phosphate dehydrogenase n=1 Tax=hydrothermal vent metagenome TaxID=652676 RepID=A0A3B0X438_9ZZZZ